MSTGLLLMIQKSQGWHLYKSISTTPCPSYQIIEINWKRTKICYLNISLPKLFAKQIQVREYGEYFVSFEFFDYLSGVN
uniref:Uncharacterized protein n=1 Tax=Rhizophagus irregularis (strain DAOM 181602 / DAOM 197198 / MUCL 43194) TaxID=747089 RepID=U9UQF2_RHIID